MVRPDRQDDTEPRVRRQRLRRCWADHNDRQADEAVRKQAGLEFWAIIANQLLDRLKARLGKEHRGILTSEDVEDCCNTALDSFINGKASHVVDPEAYIWRACKNACIDESRRRDRHQEAEQDLQTEFTRRTGMRPSRSSRSPSKKRQDRDEVQMDHAIVQLIVEEAVGAVDAPGPWMAEVVEASIIRLRPALQRVARYLMLQGDEVKDADAAVDLKLTPKSFRSNKSKALSELKALIPTVVQELGITLTRGAEEAIFREQHELAMDDDDDAG